MTVQLQTLTKSQTVTVPGGTVEVLQRLDPAGRTKVGPFVNELVAWALANGPWKDHVPPPPTRPEPIVTPRPTPDEESVQPLNRMNGLHQPKAAPLPTAYDEVRRTGRHRFGQNWSVEDKVVDKWEGWLDDGSNRVRVRLLDHLGRAEWDWYYVGGSATHLDGPHDGHDGTVYYLIKPHELVKRRSQRVVRSPK